MIIFFLIFLIHNIHFNELGCQKIKRREIPKYERLDQIKIELNLKLNPKLE